MNIKFDLHTHVGVIPASKRNNSLTAQVTPEQAAAYLKKYGITHTVILYSDYTYLEELSTLVDTKLYGVKWINDPEYDSLDQGRPLYYGVKLHSHRGTYLRNSVRHYGVDYTDSQIMYKLLNRMQPGELVYLHTQGSPVVLNKAAPRAVFRLACKYPSLKFIMGHAGAYGGMSSSRPVPAMLFDEQGTETPEGQKYLSGLVDYAFNRNSIAEAAEYTTLTHNIFLDTSVHFSYKAQILKDYKKWCIGSDFPFGVEADYNYDTQYRRFSTTIPEETLQGQSLEALKFIETSIQDLAAEHYLHIENIPFAAADGSVDAEEGEDLFDTQFAIETGILEEDEYIEESRSSKSPHQYLLELSKRAGKVTQFAPGERRGPGRPRIKPLPDPDAPKRRPGRPRLERPEGESAFPRKASNTDPDAPKRGPGRPRIKPLPDPDLPKRGPGRPPRNLNFSFNNKDVDYEQLFKMFIQNQLGKTPPPDVEEVDDIVI